MGKQPRKFGWQSLYPYIAAYCKKKGSTVGRNFRKTEITKRDEMRIQQVQRDTEYGINTCVEDINSVNKKEH